IDRSRVFLFGHSNGGVYAHILTNRTSGPWRAAATHGGFAPAQFLQAPAEAKPFRMYLGTAEHIFPPDAAEAVGRAMAKAGHAVDLVIIPYHTHWFYDAGPKIADDAWGWFEGIGG
ncbi:MAG: dienelactone hydrolase family protein, partial [Pseudomonadota bacterium]